MKHKLEADSIQLSFGERTILSNIYIRCSTGQITGLLGRNGQGKSCLMRIMHGTLQTERKSIRFDATSVFKPYKRPDFLMYLPQFNFIPALLTLKQILKDFQIEERQLVQDSSEFEKNLKTKIGLLSGGERRFIELYCIITAPSQFAILDEPFTHLNPIQIEKVKDLLLKAKEKKGLLITDHMFRHVLDVSDDIYLLKDGRTQLIRNMEELETLEYARL